MSGKYLSKVQFGKETTSGTAVAADTIFVGQVQAPAPDRAPYFPDEQFGVRTGKHRAVTHQYLVNHSLRCADGYFQALPAIFGCGLKGAVSPTEQTVSEGDYLWAFTPSLTGNNSPDSLTIEVGDNTNAQEVEYCMFERIKISGQVAQGAEPSPVSIEADYFGRQWDRTASFTGGLSLPTQSPINAKLARIYIDDSWANVGTTEKTNVLRSFDVEILTGVHPRFSGSGNKYFNAHAEGELGAMGAFVFERGAASEAVYDDYDANTFRVVRLEIIGDQIGAGENHKLTIDIGGYFESVSPMGQEDRALYQDPLSIQAVYDPTAAKMFDVQLITDVSAY